MEHSGPGVTTPSKDAPFREGEAEDVSRAARGDRRAFERLYRSHVARVHSLARRMVGHDEANEMTQDVFVRAWEKLGTFRGESAFGTWLYRLAINVILARRGQLARERGRRGGGGENAEALPAPGSMTHLGIDFETPGARLPGGAGENF